MEAFAVGNIITVALKRGVIVNETMMERIAAVAEIIAKALRFSQI
jgi:hypothetical protein